MFKTRKINAERTLQPGPKVKQGKRKMMKIAAQSSGSKHAANKAVDQIAEGIRITAEQVMDPDGVFFLPCGTAARVTGTHYRKENVLSPADPTEEFSGVIIQRPSLLEFLKINTLNGSPISVANASLAGRDGVPLIPVEIVLDNFYFPAFEVQDSNGVRVGVSHLQQVERADCWAQSPETGEWIRGFINVVDANCTASTNCTYENLIYHTEGSTSNIACTMYVGQVDANGDFVFYASASSGSGNTGGAFADLAGVAGTGVSYAVKATTDVGGITMQVRSRIQLLDLTNFDPVDYFQQPQTITDAIYTTLRDNSTGLRLSAMSLRCTFEGSDMNNAGLIAVARVPEGTPIPSGTARDVYTWISSLPYDNYTGPVKNGGHVFWIPKTLRDITFKERADPLSHSNLLIMAFIVPGSSAGQITSLSIVSKSTWEWIYDSQSLPQFRAPPGWMFLEALYAVIGQYNPSGENPKHLAKIKEIAKRVMQNPAVRALGQQAMQLAVTTAAKQLPKLIAGVAV